MSGFQPLFEELKGALCKKVLSLFAVLVIFLLFPLAVSSHSGGTDSAGGHYDHSTGKYHYHHGYPAHQHENGQCPYDSKRVSHVHNDDGNWEVLIGTLVVIASVFLFLFIFSRIPAKKVKAVKTPPEKAPSRSIPCISLTDEEKQLLTTMAMKAKNNEEVSDDCADNSLSEPPTIPDGSEIGDDNLPRDKEVSAEYPWGKTYTFFTSASGNTYHNRNCQFVSFKSIPRNAYYLKKHLCFPCKRCLPFLPDTSWVDKYFKYTASNHGQTDTIRDNEQL